MIIISLSSSSTSHPHQSLAVVIFSLIVQSVAVQCIMVQFVIVQVLTVEFIILFNFALFKLSLFNPCLTIRFPQYLNVQALLA